MMLGVFLGIALAVFVSSVFFIAVDVINSFQENVLTGAVVGTSGATSYFVVSAVVSLIVIVLLIFLMKKEYKDIIEGRESL